MTIDLEQFQAAVVALQQLLPMGKQLTPAALVLAWDTLPERAKLDLTDEILLFAVQQRLLDPAPPKDLAPHLALLRYAYRLENDRPLVEHGLRPDLRQRMAAPDRFHDPAPARQEQAPPPLPSLPAGSTHWHPSQLTPQQRRAHVEQVAACVAKLRTKAPDPRPWTPAQLLQGRRWFEHALQGFWPMRTDDGSSLANAWVLRNAKWADDLIEAARQGDVKPVPAERVVKAFAGVR